MNFKIRVSKVLVTGGGSGIGFSIAKALIDEGCNVCICGRDLKKLEIAKEKINNNNLSILQWDVCNINIIREKINEAASLVGGYLDGLVNNAGIFLPYDGWKPWNETSLEWDNVWNTNLKAQIFILRTFSTYLNQNHIKGNILVISSITAYNSIIEGSYAASKYALTKMVRSHAKHVLNLGIVINGILPGVTATNITSNKKPNDFYKGNAIQRILSPNEIAKLSLFLMSDEASICAGEFLDASGGFYGTI